MAKATPTFTDDEPQAVVRQERTTRVDISNGYTSITGDDVETRKKVYAAVSNAEKVADHLNEPFILKDILIQRVQAENEDTGEIDDYLRTTLVRDEGPALAAGSEGIANSVDTMLAIMGEPSTWPAEGYKVQVVERKGKRGKFFSIEFVND